MYKYLIFGNGFLGNKFKNYLGDDAILIKEKISSIENIEDIIHKYKPKTVINCIGKTGRPNIDWCESNKKNTFFSNVTIPMMMAEVCKDMDKYLVHIGSGCIYSDCSLHGPWTESDKPNFKGSFYSKTKTWSEKILSEYDNVLQLRIRMPIDDVPSPRNLIDKLIKYEKVIGDVPNSITCIPDLMNTAKELMNREEVGIFNVVTKTPINHKRILEMYKGIVDHKFEMPEFISLEELKNITLAERSNCVLSVDKLKRIGIDVRDTEEAIEDCLEKYKEHIKENAQI